MRRLRRIATLLACGALASALAAAQTRGATRTKYTPPVYPEDAGKKDLQGNVLLIGRIDPQGHVTDLRVVAATHQDFAAPALEAVRSWQFDPALRDGKPIEVPLNAAARFRMTGGGRGRIPAPILGDFAVYPADASGAKTAPDGFPLRKGKDAALRAEVAIDVPPAEELRTLTVNVEAISPKGRKIPVFQPPVAIPALSTGVTIPVVARVGPDWEEGVWILRITADGKNAGGGQFWLAKDPDTFRFTLPAL